MNVTYYLQADGGGPLIFISDKNMTSFLVAIVQRVNLGIIILVKQLSKQNEYDLLIGEIILPCHL